MEIEQPTQPPGRGAVADSDSRFDKLHCLLDLDNSAEDAAQSPSALDTQVLPEAVHSLITYNDSRNFGFDAEIDVCRGCEHGCAYCFARPTHEHLGLSAGLDLKTKIFATRSSYCAPS